MNNPYLTALTLFLAWLFPLLGALFVSKWLLLCWLYACALSATVAYNNALEDVTGNICECGNIKDLQTICDNCVGDMQHPDY